MTNPAETFLMNESMPFQHNKIPVSNGLEGFIEFAGQYPGFSFCPYIADKDPAQWDVSTSRGYMNQVLPNFLYVPVNIPKGDQQQLASFFDYVAQQPHIPAVNITQPHKSNPVLRRLFLGDEHTDANVDTLIRDESGRLVPFDLNAAAFVGWYLDEVGGFEGKNVVLIGVGGVGEPMAKHIAKQHPKQLTLIDPVDKHTLADSLASETASTYLSSLEPLSDLPAGAIVINAAGKEGATEDSQLGALLEKNASRDNVFVDIRPQLEVEIVEMAKTLGWQSHTGHGMNARNDYELLLGIARNLHVDPMSFDEFERLVAAAS